MPLAPKSTRSINLSQHSLSSRRPLPLTNTSTQWKILSRFPNLSNRARFQKVHSWQNENGTGDSNGGPEKKEEEEDMWAAAVTAMVEDAKKRKMENILKQEKTIKGIELEKEKMQAAGSPGVALNFMQWLIDLSKSAKDSEVDSLQQLEESKEKFVAELKAWDEETSKKMKDPLIQEEYADWVVDGDNASLNATQLVFSSFIGMFAATWVASWFGIEIASILPDPSLPSASQLATFVGWSAPYLGATAIAAAIAPSWIGNRGTYRFLAEDDFFGKLHPTGILSLAATFGYTHAVIYQGVGFLAWLSTYSHGGDPLLLDPAAADDLAVQQAMGSLVAAPGLFVLLAKPAAVLSAAVVETGYFIVQESISSNVEAFLNADESMLSGMKVIDVTASTSESEGTTVTSVDVTNLPQLKLEKLKMTSEEFYLTVGRIFASSVWLGAETMLTGNLWYAVGTGTLGLLIGMATSRAQARGA